MATDVKLPELGENIDSAKIVKVLVSKGDSVDDQQPIVEVETDKATAEVPSSGAGTVSEVRVSEGDDVSTGDVLIVLDGEAGDEDDEHEGADGKKDRPTKKKKKGRKKEQRATEEGKAGADEEAEPEAEPAAGEEAAEEKDEEKDEEGKEARASKDKEPPPAGDRRDQRQKARGREDRDRKRPSTGAEEAEEASGVSPADEEPETHLVAAPSVRRIARELGVDLASVQGSGPGGRISIDDVHRHARFTPTAGTLPDLTAWGDVSRDPLSEVRKTIAEHMIRSWTSIPHVTLFDEADVTALDRIRQRYEHKAEEAGTKLTFTAILLKVCAAALHAFPRVNASIDIARGELIIKHYVHIGVAVETNRGLLVPVIRDANHKNVIELAAAISELAEKAREGKLEADEMKGGSFTITNLGGIGIGRFTPVVNWPEVAILGVGKATRRAVYRNADFEPRLMMPLSLSFDHRAIDGAEGARFLRWIVDALEDPIMISMEG